jgi:DMSO reductase family type II enzyme heme b subunit
MKALIAVIAVVMLTGAGLAADPAAQLVRSGRMSAATMISGPLPLDPNHIAWANAAPVTLMAYPQQMIAPGLENGAPIPVEMRVLTSSKRLAVKLSWSDRSLNRRRNDSTDAFADGAAIQFTRLSKHGSLPYIGMGETGRPVSIWFWREGSRPELLVARGFGTLGSGQGDAPHVNSIWSDGKWSVVFIGPLPNSQSPLPLAIAIWDGQQQGRDGRKHMTSWHLLRLPGRVEQPDILADLIREAAVLGDVARGKALAQEHGCGGCHRLPNAEPVDVGPDLEFAGGDHWPGYLRRSIVNPSDFVVPLARYRGITGQGREQSLMPKSKLSDRDVDDLVAYLASLR